MSEIDRFSSSFDHRHTTSHRCKLFLYIKKWRRPGIFVSLRALALVTDVLIDQSFADWFTHYSLVKIYSFDPSFGPKISPNHLSYDAKIFIGPRGFLSYMSDGPSNFCEHCFRGKHVLGA